MQSKEWLNSLYEANFDRLYRLASHILYRDIGHASDALDVVSDVFLLAEKKKIYNHPNPVGWLIQATKNTCRNYVRANRRNMRKQNRYAQEMFPKNPHTTQAFAEPEKDETAVSDIMVSLEQSLPTEDYELVKQYCIKGHTAEEIAQEKGMNAKAIRMRISRIRARLREIL